MVDAGPPWRFSSFLFQILHPQEITLTRIVHVYQRWVQLTLQKREQAKIRRGLFDRLIAAYRQYHLAAGGYFVPHSLSQAKAQRLLVGRSGLVHVFSGWAYDLRRSPHILSVADVAGLLAFPHFRRPSELPPLE